jgi:hypothetical protein
MKRNSIFLILLMTPVWACQTIAQFEVNLHLTEDLVDTEIKSAIETNTSLLLSEILKAFREERTPDFTGMNIYPEASKTILDIWNNSSVMYCSVPKLNIKCLKRCEGGYQARDIPIVMLEAPDDRQQKILINYTDNGTIYDICLAVDSIPTISGKDKEDKEKCRRQKILDFIELYRTSYYTKDLNFLNAVCNPDKILFPRKVLNSELPYKRQINMQYLQNLKYLFATTGYISMKFTDMEVRQHPKYSEIYGLTFKQTWHTAYPNGYVYDDAGYVFLMMDFRNENNPEIFNCTWQPEEYGGKKLSTEEIFKDNFNSINIKQ